MKTKVFFLLAALTFSAAAFAQQKTMYIMKDGRIMHEIAVSDVDSIIFYKPDVAPEWVLINGVKWAIRNVNAPGTFTARPEDYGMFYQWNSKIGWSAKDPLTPSDGKTTWNKDWNGNNATTWEKANDPCPAGFRMPKTYELEALAASGFTEVTVNGVKGTRFGSGANTIFLPAAGYRYYDNTDGKVGELFSVGETGYYWSGTQHNEGSAYYINSYNGSVLPSWSKAEGLSCRCVAE